MKNCLDLKTWLMPLAIISFLISNINQVEAQTVRILNSNPRGGGGNGCAIKSSNQLDVYILVRNSVDADISSIKIEGLDDQVISESISDLGYNGDGYRLISYQFFLMNDLGFYTGSTNIEENQEIKYTFNFMLVGSGTGMLSSSVINPSGLNSGIPISVNSSSEYCKQSIVLRKGTTNTESEVIDVEIFPNPVRDYVSIKIKTSNISNISIDILNELGQKVSSYSIEVNSGNQQTQVQEVDMSHLAKGIYYVRLMSKEKIHTKKIVKL